MCITALNRAFQENILEKYSDAHQITFFIVLLKKKMNVSYNKIIIGSYICK